MDERTLQHLRTAAENAQFARDRLAAATPTNVRWALVAAFYSALHYVNAYLWETARLEPHDHAERRAIVARWTVLASVREEYEQLLDSGFRARYDPDFQMPPQRANLLVTDALPTIERVIVAALR